MKSIGILFLFVSSTLLSSAQCISGDCTNGWGTYKWESGDKYTGEWQSGNRTGLGVYDWENGAFYYGYFQNGKLEGDGFYIGLDSTQDQIGVFHNGALAEEKSFELTGCVIGNCTDGGGVYLWESNDLYIGEWQTGARTGYGRYDWEDGGWYIGTFKDGKLDGTGEYHPHDADVMKGTFEDGVFKSSSNDAPYKATTTTSSTASYPDRKINEADFCSVIKNVISDYTNNFENIKGAKDEDDDYGDSWTSTWKLSGSKEAVIAEPLLSGHNSWYNVLYESANLSDAKAKYDEYVSTMKSCGSNCCTLVYDTHDYKGESYESHSTFWLPLAVKEGYSDDYKKLEVEIEYANQISGDGWEVIARIKLSDQ